MDWIIKAAEKQNEERRRQQTIEKGAPTIWENTARAVEQAYGSYAAIDGVQRVEFSGRANHTIWVAVLEPRPTGRGTERERVTITYDAITHTVEVRSSLHHGEPKVFSIGFNCLGTSVCLMEKDHEIPVEQFTEMALHDAFFPKKT